MGLARFTFSISPPFKEVGLKKKTKVKLKLVGHGTIKLVSLGLGQVGGKTKADSI